MWLIGILALVLLAGCMLILGDGNTVETRDMSLIHHEGSTKIEKDEVTNDTTTKPDKD